jgi:hypothetical protein
MELVKRNIEAVMVSRLESIGRSIIEKAYADQESGTNEWKSHTNNLAAGFACVVFLRGKVAYNTDREKAISFTQGMGDPLQWHRGWKKHGIPDGNALLWFDRWLKSYKPKSNKFELVLVNATYYGKILEEGRQGKLGGRKFKVLTYLINELTDKARKFDKNAIVSIL